MHKHKRLQLFYTVPAIVTATVTSVRQIQFGLLCMVSIRGYQACQSTCYRNNIYFHISNAALTTSGVTSQSGRRGGELGTCAVIKVEQTKPDESNLSVYTEWSVICTIG